MIGNKVFWNVNVITIESICEDKVNVFAGYNGDDPYVHGLDCSKIEPIPLTVELLECCSLQVHCYYKEDACLVFNNKVLFASYYQSKAELSIDKIYPRRLKYLHELQNYFYAIYGTELTINLEKVKA